MARLKPPASRDDEQKHGKVLRKQTNELAKRDREINALLSHVDFLISLVNKEKTLSQARDVTRFTYATVFFLPVGLAVSIFMGVFRAGKSEELIHASSVQEIVKPITANPEKVDEADTNEESISPAGHRSITRYISHKIGALSALRHRHAARENEGDDRA
ncbi:hypothetical protein BO86DRAFT_396116 [Aspergillus japonicus CBS 114.51]|uniref:Transmembrane protein n=1 Tax=Aspergillus japonicus CBS 114.51 TaxID=1448312 RepID=A0A8T8XER8_ASPJA|nr:hypothetical protein BO86DRAFT_396116 [Aspergillus japonicus CBS 114.51]RAH85829.1 hypothetical protein BO86DRAFT_396116 [Aspergillus japonicus CBS 114.51]